MTTSRLVRQRQLQHIPLDGPADTVIRRMEEEEASAADERMWEPARTFETAEEELSPPPQEQSAL